MQWERPVTGPSDLMAWLEQHEQRLRALEAENRELRRQLDELRWSASAQRPAVPYPAAPYSVTPPVSPPVSPRPATPHPPIPYASQGAIPGPGTGSVPAMPAAGPLGQGHNAYANPQAGAPLWSTPSAPMPAARPGGNMSGASDFFAALSGSHPVPAVTPYGTDPSHGRLPSQAGRPGTNPYPAAQPGAHGQGYTSIPRWDTSGQAPARRRPSYPPPPVGEPERRAPTYPPREQQPPQGEERNPYTDSFLL